MRLGRVSRYATSKAKVSLSGTEIKTYFKVMARDFRKTSSWNRRRKFLNPINAAVLEPSE